MHEFFPAYSPPPPHTLGAEVFFMESLTPFIRHELEDAPGPSGPPEEDESGVLQLVEWREEAPYG